MPDSMQFASAITTERDVDSAAAALTDEIHAQVDLSALDFTMAFFSDYAAVAPSGADRLNTTLNPRVPVGCTSEGVIGKAEEIENRPAIALVAARLPGLNLVPFALNSDDWDALEDAAGLRALIGAPGDTRLIVIRRVYLAGFFAAGEIGPVGGKNFLHGHTASMARFRPRSAYAGK